MVEFGVRGEPNFAGISAIEAYKFSKEIRRTIDAYYTPNVSEIIWIEVQASQVRQARVFCDWVNRKPAVFKDLREIVYTYDYGVTLEAEEFKEAMTVDFVNRCHNSLNGERVILESEIKDVYGLTKQKSPLRSVLVDYFLT